MPRAAPNAPGRRGGSQPQSAGRGSGWSRGAAGLVPGKGEAGAGSPCPWGGRREQLRKATDSKTQGILPALTTSVSFFKGLCTE